MSETSARPGERVTTWGIAAFLVGGVARLANVALYQFLGTLEVAFAESVLDLLLVLAFGGAFVGLYYLSPIIVEHRPKWGYVGVLAIGTGMMSLVGLVVGKYAIGGPNPTGFLKVLPVLFIVCAAVSFVLYGTIGLRTRVLSRPVALLLVVVGASRLLALTGMVNLAATLFALPLLALGHLLRLEVGPVERPDAFQDGVRG